MATEITLSIGAMYSKRLSQTVTAEINMANLPLTDAQVTSEIAEVLASFVARLEGDEVINPKAKDAPCCDKFEELALNMEKDAKFCPNCGVVITDERRKKFLSK